MSTAEGKKQKTKNKKRNHIPWVLGDHKLAN
jgi:hypothetical protein